MEAATYLIAAMRDRPDRVASALWIWMQHYRQTTEQLADYLDCSAETLQRLAEVTRPQPGPDWDLDVEIIAISLRLDHQALCELMYAADHPHEREFGA